MGENAYCLYKAILLTVLGVAVLIIGWRYAENGATFKSIRESGPKEAALYGAWIPARGKSSSTNAEPLNT